MSTRHGAGPEWLVLGARVLFVLLSLAVLVMIALADRGSDNALLELTRARYNADKVVHFIVYGVLSFLLHLSLRAAAWGRGRLALPKAPVWVLLFGLAEELSQLFSPVRTFDLRDLYANLAGALLFTLLAMLVWRLAQPSSAAQRS